MTQEALRVAANLVKEFEGFRSEPYICPAGKWTIGYGTTKIKGVDVSANTPPVTEAGALLLAQQDMVGAASDVDRLVVAHLTVNQRAALIDFVYNIGATKFATSTMRVHLNSNRMAAAAEQFDVWIYATNPATKRLEPMNGLRRRRAAEKELFLKPDEV